MKIKKFFIKIILKIIEEIATFVVFMMMLGIVILIWGSLLYIYLLLFKDFSYIFAFFSGAFSLALTLVLVDYLIEKIKY